ncbi:MAG: photosystem I reaction center subunit PsaK [Hydrococcus sp. C42_A2020_068]|uniref:photosystem I reaction center subunit PsaK n=1 Tax=Pleurocapsa sp. PCC 7327 TaxID=118163 RepID=UPI00029FB9CD|nr:photosystem I reaction center subunit PsaK [Pleurocapsa sp. PCC 7327]AFY76993.1 photosystem I reaction center subunit PsaK [Pleurocapsa sp. PCC 7327]MBF2022458.1 photosystem I reaction center subunit PsaK [Hydrococcus sp. C42_A2020_068]
MISTLIMAAQTNVPSTSEWNLSVAIVMIFCNLLAIVIGYFAIQNTGAGPDLPIPQLASRKSFGLPELLATTSFGHILGAGMILGLSNAGIL